MACLLKLRSTATQETDQLADLIHSAVEIEDLANEPFQEADNL